jgi:hypothetical protein
MKIKFFGTRKPTNKKGIWKFYDFDFPNPKPSMQKIINEIAYHEWLHNRIYKLFGIDSVIFLKGEQDGCLCSGITIPCKTTRSFTRQVLMELLQFILDIGHKIIYILNGYKRFEERDDMSISELLLHDLKFYIDQYFGKKRIQYCISKFKLYISPKKITRYMSVGQLP